MAHVSGQSISQTIYTCTFLHVSKLHPQVQTGILATLKTIDCWRSLLYRSRIVSDEDYTFDTAGFTLFEDLPGETVCEEIGYQLGKLESEADLKAEALRIRYQFIRVRSRVLG